METGGPSVIQIIIWVLAAIVLPLLAAYGLVKWMHSQTREAIRKLGAQIADYDRQLSEAANFLQAYEGVQQEPFSTPLESLQTEIGALNARLQEFLDRSSQFETEMAQPRGNSAAEIINAPFHSVRRWRETKALHRESDEIGAGLKHVETQVENIYRIPWDLALQCRQAQKDTTELTELVRDLTAWSARGKKMEVVSGLPPRLSRALDEIPQEYFEADEPALMAAANLDSTIRVFEALGRIRPAVSRYLPQVREWRSSYQKASNEYAGLKQAGAVLRQSLATPPEGLSIAPLQSKLDQVAQLAAELNQRLVQPEVEDLRGLAREVGQLRRVLQDTETLYQRATKQVTELGEALLDLRRGVTDLAGQFSGLEHAPVHPVLWDISAARLADLRARLEALGPANLSRTPDQITQHLREVETLRGQYKSLMETYPRVAELHRALLVLLGAAELKEGLPWLRKAREMAEQTSIYDLKNWPRQDSVQTLGAELETLEHDHRTLVPADPTAPVKESSLEDLLKELRGLEEQHKALQVRTGNIRTRLEKIQSLEAAAKDRLNAAYTALDRVTLLTESNDLLFETANADTSRLIEEIRQLGNELNDRGQGEIDRKVTRINQLVDKVNKAMNGWLARINTVVSDMGKQLNEQMTKIDSVGMFEDAPIQQAKNLLANGDFSSHGARGTGPLGGAGRAVAARLGHSESKSAEDDLLAVTAEIKRKNDLWQSLTGVQKALEAQCGPLMEAYQEAIAARSEAQERLTEAASRAPSQRTWRPHNQMPLPESQTLKPVDEKWEMLKKRQARIDAAILEIGRLAQQYRLVTEHARHHIERIDQDQERIQELEWQVDDLKQRWQAQAQGDPTNAVMREGVQQLVSQADSRMAYIKQQYMRGALSYEQVIQNMQLLYDELFTTRVPVDAQADIGLNENRTVRGANR